MALRILLQLQAHVVTAEAVDARRVVAGVLTCHEYLKYMQLHSELIITIYTSKNNLKSKCLPP